MERCEYWLTKFAGSCIIYFVIAKCIHFAVADRSGEPDIIYPDFRAAPVYTEEGEPFVTLMQDACDHFKGKGRRTDDTTCAECAYCKRGEEWFGVCGCPKSRKP